MSGSFGGLFVKAKKATIIAHKKTSDNKIVVLRSITYWTSVSL